MNRAGEKWCHFSSAIDGPDRIAPAAAVEFHWSKWPVGKAPLDFPCWNQRQLRQLTVVHAQHENMKCGWEHDKEMWLYLAVSRGQLAAPCQDRKKISIAAFSACWWLGVNTVLTRNDAVLVHLLQAVILLDRFFVFLGRWMLLDVTKGGDPNPRLNQPVGWVSTYLHLSCSL